MENATHRWLDTCRPTLRAPSDRAAASGRVRKWEATAETDRQSALQLTRGAGGGVFHSSDCAWWRSPIQPLAGGESRRSIWPCFTPADWHDIALFGPEMPRSTLVMRSPFSDWATVTPPFRASALASYPRDQPGAFRIRSKALAVRIPSGSGRRHAELSTPSIFRHPPMDDQFIGFQPLPQVCHVSRGGLRYDGRPASSRLSMRRPPCRARTTRQKYSKKLSA